METQRKLSHSKCLILHIFGWLLLPDVSESSLCVCLITVWSQSLLSLRSTEYNSTTFLLPQFLTQTLLKTLGGAGLSSLQAAAIGANTWYFQGAATAPGLRRCQDDFRLIHESLKAPDPVFTTDGGGKNHLCLPTLLRQFLHQLSCGQLGLLQCKPAIKPQHKLALDQRWSGPVSLVFFSFLSFSFLNFCFICLHCLVALQGSWTHDQRAGEAPSPPLLACCLYRMQPNSSLLRLWRRLGSTPVREVTRQINY